MTYAVGDRVEVDGTQGVVVSLNLGTLVATVRFGTVNDKPILRDVHLEDLRSGQPVTSEDEVRARRQAEGLSAG